MSSSFILKSELPSRPFPLLLGLNHPSWIGIPLLSHETKGPCLVIACTMIIRNPFPVVLPNPSSTTPFSSVKKVRVSRTMRLVHKALVHVHNDCLIFVILVHRTGHLNGESTDASKSLAIERGCFDPTPTASISQPIRQPADRPVRYLLHMTAVLHDPLSNSTAEDLSPGLRSMARDLLASVDSSLRWTVR